MSEVNATAVIEEVAKFESSALNHVETTEKVVLPSKEEIESEKLHVSLVTGLETFDKGKLKPTVTEEKIVLPNQEVIEQEKSSA